MKVKGLIFILCLPLFAAQQADKAKKQPDEVFNFDGTVFEYFNSANVSLKWHDYEAEIDNIEYEFIQIVWLGYFFSLSKLNSIKALPYWVSS